MFTLHLPVLGVLPASHVSEYPVWLMSARESWMFKLHITGPRFIFISQLTDPEISMETDTWILISSPCVHTLHLPAGWTLVECSTLCLSVCRITLVEVLHVGVYTLAEYYIVVQHL